MFERFTEKGRRAVFFARREASRLGSPIIESEHLLLGLLREDKGVILGALKMKDRKDEIIAAVNAATIQREESPVNADLPLSEECKRILELAGEEAERLGAEFIGIGHLVLGILREKECLAARILTERGVEEFTARMLIFVSEKESESGEETAGVARSAYQRRSRIGIGLVELNSSEFMLTYQNSSLVPRIGETIHVKEEGNEDRTYTIEEIVWEFNREFGVSSLETVKLRVEKVN
jgi:ATP-dependent Clp protease ATP-binding subunit ClpC